MFWRFLPLGGVIALILIAGCVRPLVHLVRHGSLGVFLFRSGGPGQKVRDALLLLLIAAYVAHGLTGARRPQWVRLLVADGGALHQALQVAGAVLIVGGLVLFAAAQLNLGASWRIGIDEGARPGMVSGGLYRLSRHPIFLGLLTVFTGYAAVLPTPLSLGLLLAAYLGFRRQAAVEEAYMVRTYGEAYRRYARRVGRFLPGVGRL
jgi:protein-S-isoprenylcysteine O-methyltransferase Ste14